MKMLRLIVFFIIVVMIAGPSIAGDDKQKNGQHTSGSNVWQQFKADWQGIGKEIKNTGAQIGQSFKHEFKNMPQNIRNGCKAVNNDLKKLTQSDHSKSTNK